MPEPSPLASPTPEVPAESRLAIKVLEIASRFHAAHGDPARWMSAQEERRALFNCRSPLNLGTEGQPSRGQWLNLAKDIARCAADGLGQCHIAGCANDNFDGRPLCRSLAPHILISAGAMRHSSTPRLFDRRLPTWIVNREGRILESSHSAKALIAADLQFGIDQDRLAPRIKGAARRFWDMLAELDKIALFNLPGASGRMTTLRLLPHPEDDAIIVTLVDDADNISDTATQLATLLGLTRRQSELAAYLLAGHSIAAIAREMTISRDTAKEHFNALRLKTGTGDRLELIAVLRRSLHGS